VFQSCGYFRSFAFLYKLQNQLVKIDLLNLERIDILMLTIHDHIVSLYSFFGGGYFFFKDFIYLFEREHEQGGGRGRLPAERGA